MAGWSWVYPITPATVLILLLVALVIIVPIEGMIRWWRKERGDD